MRFVPRRRAALPLMMATLRMDGRQLLPCLAKARKAGDGTLSRNSTGRFAGCVADRYQIMIDGRVSHTACNDARFGGPAARCTSLMVHLALRLGLHVEGIRIINLCWLPSASDLSCCGADRRHRIRPRASRVKD